MKRIFALLFLSHAWFVDIAYAQTSEEATTAFNKKDYVTAIAGFRKAAEQCDINAQLNVGSAKQPRKGFLKLQLPWL